VAPEAMEYLRRLTRHAQAEPESGTDLEPNRVFGAVIRAIEDLIAAVSEERPTMVLVDDAHWMDQASAAALLRAANAQSQHAIAFVLTSRTKPVHFQEPAVTDSLVFLRMRPLTQKTARSLFVSLAALPPNQAIDTALSERIDLGAGNPLFLRWLAADDDLDTGQRLPKSLTDLFEARVRQLSDDAVRTFVAAVILGKYCRVDRLARVAGLSEESLLQTIHRLETAGFLVGDEGDIRSAHPLLSQSALVDLPPVTRQLMYSSAAMLFQREAEVDHDIGMLWQAAEHWHSAGESDRAIEVLWSCALYSNQIGQPGVACDLLQRASTMCSGARHAEVIRELIECARLAEDYPRMADAIRRFRALQGATDGTGIHDDLELIGIQAARFCGTSLVDLIPQLLRCMSASDAPSSHRLNAAIHLLPAYDLNLDRAGATALHALFISIPCADHEDWRCRYRLDIIYHCLAGSPMEGIRAARNLVALLADDVEPSRTVRPRVDAAMALFRCGECVPAIREMTHAFEDGREFGMLSSMIDSASMLAWMHHVVGDDAECKRWDRAADEYYAVARSPHERTSHYLSNKIEFAIDGNRCDEAQQWLDLAREGYAEIRAPRSRLLARAFELRLAQLKGLSVTSEHGLAALEEDHDAGKHCGLHDNFVEAYWRELVRADQPGRARQILSEYIRDYRRDGFPLTPPLRAICESERIE